MYLLYAYRVDWRRFAQNSHKVDGTLHKCTKSSSGYLYALCLESPLRFTNPSKSTTAFHVSRATYCV